MNYRDLVDSSGFAPHVRAAILAPVRDIIHIEPRSPIAERPFEPASWTDRQRLAFAFPFRPGVDHPSSLARLGRAVSIAGLTLSTKLAIDLPEDEPAIWHASVCVRDANGDEVPCGEVSTEHANIAMNCAIGLLEGVGTHEVRAFEGGICFHSIRDLTSAESRALLARELRPPKRGGGTRASGRGT